MLVLRDIKTASARTAFNRLQKEAIKAGLKTDLPTTIKEYRKQYTGSKQFATSDYYYEWTKAIGKFYNKMGHKAQKVIDENDLDISPRTEFNRIPKRGLAGTLDLYADYLRTLKNITNPNYLRADMPKEEQDKLIKRVQTLTEIDETGKKVKSKIVTKAGIKSTRRKPVNLSTFGGSSILLAYNNFLVALSELGYYRTLTLISNMKPNEWYQIFRENKDSVELVYKYREGVFSYDDTLYSIFSGEPLEDDSGYEEDIDY